MVNEESIYSLLSKERKELQSRGELPEWITTPSYQLLKDKYLAKGETLRERFSDIAECAASYMPSDKSDWYNKFFDLLWKGWLAPSTPVLTSMGRKVFTGCSVSCSGSYVEDSVYGFYEAQLEAAILSQQGFGTSSYLGDIRPRGSAISNSAGKASGVLPVFKGFVNVATDISQGATRRGAWAGYVPIDHKDFDELADHVRKFPDDANVGWNISNEFISKLEDGDTDSLRRYRKALKLKMLSGKGYFFFTDKVNNLSPDWYREKGIQVKASNLCVVPETPILTDLGYFPIIDLVDQEVNIWNGEEFSKSLVRQTGENQKILKVITSHGQELEVTEYHKWCRVLDYKGSTERVSTIELKPGDKLIKFDLPVIEGNLELKNAYHNGFFSGDGCYSKGVSIVYFYGNKRKLINLFKDIDGTWSIQEAQDRVVFRTRELKDKFFVPLNSYTIESRLQWFAGICDSDGTVSRNGDNESLQIGSVNKKFLLEIQEMLQTLGVHSRINVCRESGYNLLPANDSTGLNKEYHTETLYRLLISSSSLYKLINLGLKFNRLEVKGKLPQRDALSFNTIVEVRDEGRYSDTYCFNEPKRHMGVFGGVLTFNCTEITLPSDNNQTFTCVLSSMNAARYNEYKDTDAIYDSLIFLYCVALDFIEKGSKIRGLEKAVEFTKNHMALGLGALGFHTYLQDHLIPFDSLEAHYFNMRFFRDLDEKSLKASEDLVKLFGECPITKGYGVACSHRTAIAPNLSSALICGGVSNGIEPVYKNAYVQNTASGKMIRVNPSLLKILYDRGLNIEEATKTIINNNGSVQDVIWLSDEEKAVFLTAFELNQFAIIRHAANRQKFITQAQSINTFFSSDAEESYISEVHKYAFLNKSIKSLYYIRSETGVKAITPTCSSCE